MRARRLGVISGRVLDENQIGLSNVTVYAYRTGSKLRLAQSAVTDDRGAYRVVGLEPGRYLIRTGAMELEDRRSLLPTYFGQSPKAQGATPVESQLDREVGRIDLEPLCCRVEHRERAVGTAERHALDGLEYVVETLLR